MDNDLVSLGFVPTNKQNGKTPVDTTEDLSSIGFTPDDQYNKDTQSTQPQEQLHQSDKNDDLGSLGFIPENQKASASKQETSAQESATSVNPLGDFLRSRLDTKQTLLEKLDTLKQRKGLDAQVADGMSVGDLYAQVDDSRFNTAPDTVVKKANELVDTAFNQEKNDRWLLGGVLRDALKRGWRQAGSGAASALIGLKPGELDAGDKDTLAALKQDADAYAQNVAPRQSGSLRDVNGVGSAVAFAVESIAENIPRSIPAIAGGVVGGIVGGPVGAAVGTGAMGFGQNYGEAIQDQVDEGVMDRRYALAQGVGYSVVDSLFSAEKMFGGMMGSMLKKSASEIAKKEFIDSGKKVLFKALMAGGEEAINEPLQSGVVGRARRWAQTGTPRKKKDDGTYETDSDMVWDALDEAAGGFFSGFFLGGSGAKLQQIKNNRAVDRAKKDTILQTVVAASGHHIRQIDGYDSLALLSAINSDVNIERLQSIGSVESRTAEAIDRQLSAQREIRDNAVANMGDKARMIYNTVNNMLDGEVSFGDIDLDKPSGFNYNSVLQTLTDTPDGGKFGHDPISGIGIASKDGVYTVMNLNGLRMPADASPVFDSLEKASDFAMNLARYNEQRMEKLAPKFELMTQIAQKLSPGASVKIVDTPYGLPEEVRARYMKEVAANNGTPSAMYDAKTDMIYLMNGEIRNVGQALVTIHHEALHSELEDMSRNGELPSWLKTGTRMEEALVSAYEGRFDNPGKWKEVSDVVNEGVNRMSQKLGLKMKWNAQDAADAFMQTVNKRMAGGNNAGVTLDRPSQFGTTWMPETGKTQEEASEQAPVDLAAADQIGQQAEVTRGAETMAQTEVQPEKAAPKTTIRYTSDEFQVVDELKRAGFTDAEIQTEIQNQRTERNAAQKGATEQTQIDEAVNPTHSLEAVIDSFRAAPEKGQPFSLMQELTKGRVIHDVPVSEIEVNLPGYEQFKSDANAKTGVVAGEELTGIVNKVSVRPIVVMETKDGKKVVVTGRHRLDLYRRNGEATIPAVVLTEAEGWTSGMAKAIDAIDNIQDEKGTIRDYIRFFESAQLSDADIERLGLLNRPKGRDSYVLSRNGSPDLRNAIDWDGIHEKGITPEQAVAIAKAAPVGSVAGADGIQRVAMRSVMDGTDKALARPRLLEQYVKAMVRNAQAMQGAETQQDGFFDFMGDTSFQKRAELEGKFIAAKVADLSNLRAILNNALTRKESLQLTRAKAKELGITNTKNPEQIRRALEGVKLDIVRWSGSVLGSEQMAEINAAIEQELANVSSERAGVTMKQETPAEQTAAIAETRRINTERAALSQGVDAPLLGGNSSDLTQQPDMMADQVPTGTTLFDQTQPPTNKTDAELTQEAEEVPATVVPLKAGIAAVTRPNADGVAYSGRVKEVKADGTVVFRATAEIGADKKVKHYRSNPLTGIGGFTDMTIPSSTVMPTENITERPPTPAERAKMRQQTIANEIGYKKELEAGGVSEMRFRMKSPVEGAGNLVAVHNLSEYKLQQALEIGGFPMPSIAITRTDIGHEDFGKISIVFGKETIDPRRSGNAVYDADVWSPTVPKINLKPDASISGKISRLAWKVQTEFKDNPIVSQHFQSFKLDSDSIINSIEYKYQGLETIWEKIGKDKNALILYAATTGKLDNIVLNANGFVDETKTLETFGPDYRTWFNNLFSGYVEKQGIRNNKDFFTTLGNRRSFEATNDPITLENIMRLMKQSERTANINNVSASTVKAATAKQFRTISQIQEDAGSMRKFTKEEIEAIRKNIDRKFGEITSEIGAQNKLARYEAFTMPEGAVIDALKRYGRSITGDVFARYAKQEYGLDVSPETSAKFESAVNQVKNLPVDMFEAKPRRAVRFDEVRAVIVPEETDAKLVSRLEEKGVGPVIRYDGTEKDRLAKLNELPSDVRFRKRITSEQDKAYLDAVNRGDMETAQKMVDEAAKAAGYDIGPLFHGTSSQDSFTVFKKGGSESQGSYLNENQQAFFFADEETADNYRNSKLPLMKSYLKTNNPDQINVELELHELASSYDGDLNELANAGYPVARWQGKGSESFEDNRSAVAYFDDNADELYERAKSDNRDGIIIDGVDGSILAIVFDPEQIKSAEPVTYDDSGNIIPLSERFNEDREDIRFRKTENPEKEYEAVKAKYRGTDKWMKAPNGNKTALTEREWIQVRTPSFKRWFGDWEAVANGKDGNGVWAIGAKYVSKVVDKNGEPLVVYHGTNSFGFTEMNPYKADGHRSPMVFTTDDYGTARSYANGAHIGELKTLEEEVTDDVLEYAARQEGWDYESFDELPGLWAELTDVQQYDLLANYRSENGSENMGGGVYSLFLNIRNPYESYFEGRNWDGGSNGLYEVMDEDGERQYDEKNGKGLFTDDEAEAFANELGEKTGKSYKLEEAEGFETTNSVAEVALKYGHDGAIIRQVLDDGGRGGNAQVSDVYVIFDANQAKSSTDNTGAFSQMDNDIRFRRARADYIRAIPSTEPANRDMQFTVENQYADALDKRTVQETVRKGRMAYEKDRRAAELALLSGIKLTGRTLDDAHRMAVDKIVVDDLTTEAVSNPTDENKNATAMLGVWRWYERGTEAARALQIRFDPVNTPEGRRAYLMRMIYQPTKEDMQRLKKAATMADQIEILKPRAKQAAKLLKILKDKGIEIPNLTTQMLMDPSFVDEIMRDISIHRADWKDKTHEYWRNAILSGPATQTANIVGNLGHAVLDLGVLRPAEAVANLFIRNPDAASIRSVAAMYKAMTPAIQQANRNFIYAWSNERSGVGPQSSKMEESNAAISDKWGGRIIRVPQRLMAATDDWFKTVFLAGLNADYATREFDQLVADGKLQESERQAYLNDSMSEDSGAFAKAWGETLRLTFQQEPGQFASTIMSLRNHPQAGFLMKFIFPFVKTPANILSTGFRKTPLHLPLYVYRLLTDQYQSHDKVRLGVEQAAGLIVMTALYGMLQGDDDDELKRPRITGSRKNWKFSTPGERTFAQRNEPPMSIRIGDKWVSYARLEPFATMIGTTVDALNAWKYAREGKWDDFGDQIISAMVNNVRDKNFLQGVDNLMSVMEGDVSIFSDIASGFMPNLVRSTVRAFDPYVRDMSNRGKGVEWLKNEAKKTAQKTLPLADVMPNAKRDVAGKPIEKATGPLYNALIPAPVQDATQKTKIDAMLDRWNDSVDKRDRWWPTVPRPTEYTFGKDKVKMNDDEYDRYQQEAGELAARMLKQVQFRYDNPTEIDIKRLKDIYEKARSVTRERIRPVVFQRWRSEQR